MFLVPRFLLIMAIFLTSLAAETFLEQTRTFSCINRDEVTLRQIAANQAMLYLPGRDPITIPLVDSAIEYRYEDDTSTFWFENDEGLLLMRGSLATTCWLDTERSAQMRARLDDEAAQAKAEAEASLPEPVSSAASSLASSLASSKSSVASKAASSASSASANSSVSSSSKSSASSAAVAVVMPDPKAYSVVPAAETTYLQSLPEEDKEVTEVAPPKAPKVTKQFSRSPIEPRRGNIWGFADDLTWEMVLDRNTLTLHRIDSDHLLRFKNVEIREDMRHGITWLQAKNGKSTVRVKITKQPCSGIDGEKYERHVEVTLGRTILSRGCGTVLK